MSDPINNNLRVSGQYNAFGNTELDQTDKPVNRLDVLKLGGDEGVGISGKMKSGKVMVEVGKGENAPDTRGTARNRGQQVKDFFTKIGNGIKTIFKDIAAGFKKAFDKLGQIGNQAATATGTTGQTGGSKGTEQTGKSKAPTLPMIDYPQIGKEIAIAVKSGNPQALAEVLVKIENRIEKNMTESTTATREGLVATSFRLTGAGGHAILPEHVQPMKEMVPELRVKFAESPTILLMLDKLDGFDFQKEFKADLDDHLKGLRNVDDSQGRVNIGTFLRSNTFFSAAMKVEQMKSFDAEQYSKGVVAKHVDSMKGLANMVETENKKGGQQIAKLDNSIGNPFADKIIEVSRNVLDTLIQVDGPGGMKERFGEEHLTNLKETANYIASQEDILPELRNEAIFKLYNNDLFLRGVMPAMSIDPNTRSVPMKGGAMVMATVQSVMNNASGDKMSEDMSNGFIELRDEYQTKLVGAFMELGMPVVGVD
jgi:hypothetical protein